METANKAELLTTIPEEEVVKETTPGKDAGGDGRQSRGGESEAAEDAEISVQAMAENSSELEKRAAVTEYTTIDQRMTMRNLLQLSKRFPPSALPGKRKNGLNLLQFRHSVRQAIGHHVPEDEIDGVFIKINSSSDGVIDWEVSSGHYHILTGC